jgi:hypothetical protein
MTPEQIKTAERAFELRDEERRKKHEAMNDKVLQFEPPGEQIEVFEPEASTEPPEFRRTNTNDLMAATFQPLKAIVPGYVYGGFVVLAGRQKLGKTWLAIDWAVAIATGGVALGSIDCVPGDVLYIDLENGPRRIQARIRALFPYSHSLPDMSRLEWVTEAPQLDKGFIDRLERWRVSVKDPRMVVIDVFSGSSPRATGRRTPTSRITPSGHRCRNGRPLMAWPCSACTIPAKGLPTILSRRCRVPMAYRRAPTPPSCWTRTKMAGRFTSAGATSRKKKPL